MSAEYLLDIIILLAAAVIAVPFFQAIRLGAVSGFLVAGVIVGPYGFGLIANVHEIENLSEIGVVLLLFVIGIELKPARLWQMRRLVFGLGTLQVLITGGTISYLCYGYLNISLQASILVGPALALSSTAFVLQILTEQKKLHSVYGRAAFSVLLLQDLFVVPLLALVPLLAMPDLTINENIGVAFVESLVLLSLVILGGRFFLHPILHRVALSNNPEIFTASAVLIVLGTALIAEYIGFSMAMGAFLAGMFISDSSYRHQVMAEIQPFRGLLLGLFFMSMGMALNVNLLIENPIDSLMLLGLLILIKAGILFPLAFLFGLDNKKSAAVALILAQSGEFALVLFSLAFQAKILSDLLYQQLLLIVLLSMLITPALAYFAKYFSKDKHLKTEDILGFPIENPIVIAGFGRVGRCIGEILLSAGKPFIALDFDAKNVERARAKGYPVFYGDVCKPEMMKAAGASKAEIIVVTINDSAATEDVVASIRINYPDKVVYVRGHSLSQCRKLKQMGVSGVVSETLQVSLDLSTMVLVNAGISYRKRAALLAEFRRGYEANIETGLDTKTNKL